MNLPDYPSEPDELWNLMRDSGMDPWDRIETAMKHRWHPIPDWGPDGHDLGDWPLVVIYVRNSPDRFELAETVEGDATQWSFPSTELRNEALVALDRRWRTALTS